MTDDGRPLSGQIRDAVSDAIDAVIGEHEHGFVTKWVAIVETVDPNGVRGVWAMASEGATSWDSIGLLEYARQQELLALAEQRVDEDDD